MRLFVILCFSCWTVQALVFPILPNDNGAYDPKHGVVPSFQTAWKEDQHAILDLHGANGVAIAPKWVLTAWHLVRGMDNRYFFQFEGSPAYRLEERIELGNDLALVRVDKDIPIYSKLKRGQVPRGGVFTVYGQSSAARDPLFPELGKFSGWKTVPTNYHKALRKGRGSRAYHPGYSENDIFWTFPDPLLGTDSCVAALMDSGGGMFLGRELAGIVTVGGSGSARKRTSPIGTGCEAGYIVNFTNLLECTSSGQPYVSPSKGCAVAGYLEAIYARISPPLRFNAGGNEALLKDWKPWIAVDWGLVSEAVDTNGVANAAPQAVYQTYTAKYKAQGQAIELVAKGLLRFDHYSVRLHFATVVGGKGVFVQDLRVNQELMGSFDPWVAANGLPGKAIVVEFERIQPTNSDEIRILITPASGNGNMMICGAEIILE